MKKKKMLEEKNWKTKKTSSRTDNMEFEANDFIKTTPEFANVIQMIELLTAKKQKLKEDMETLKTLKEQALENPFSWKLNSIPKREPINVELPEIDWNKFSRDPHAKDDSHIRTDFNFDVPNPLLADPQDEEEQEMNLDTFFAPDSPSNPDIDSPNNDSPAKIDSLFGTSSSTPSTPSTPPKSEKRKGEKQKEKEKEKKSKKSEKRSKEGASPKKKTVQVQDEKDDLWTEKEQKQLENLLMVFPDEAVPANRWKKIAAELGNRTPKQVANRTQKYFMKLEKRGQTIPSKMSNVELYVEQPNQKEKEKKKRKIKI